VVYSAPNAAFAAPLSTDGMFFSLSKTADVLAAPLTWTLFLWILALALRRRPRPAWILGLGGLIVLAVFSFEPIAGHLVRWTEAGAVRTFSPATTYDAVIVLGGIVDPAAAYHSGELEMVDSAERIIRATALLRQGRARFVLLSAGLTSREPDEPSEADRLAAYLREEGIAPDRIVTESRSRNTHENAVESARIIAERGWRRLLLVTSAWHAPRALGCFRAAGLDPDVLPVDHRATDGSDNTLLPRAAALAMSTDMLRELLGRVVYRIAGYSR